MHDKTAQWREKNSLALATLEQKRASLKAAEASFQIGRTKLKANQEAVQSLDAEIRALKEMVQRPATFDDFPVEMQAEIEAEAQSNTVLEESQVLSGQQKQLEQLATLIVKNEEEKAAALAQTEEYERQIKQVS